MNLNPLAFIQKDFLSLEFYLQNKKDECLSIKDIKRHLLIKMRQLNNEIPDHFYKQKIDSYFDYCKNEKDKISKINTLSDLFIKGICNSLALEFLEFGENKHIYVKEDKFLEWQNLISNMSPAFLIAAFLVSDNGMENATDLNVETIRKNFSDYILPNCKYTVLLSPRIKPVQDLFEVNEGFNDLHIHLNGVTEMDGVWQNLFYNCDKNLIEIAKKIKCEGFKQQLEQINISSENDISFIKNLLKRVFAIRSELFDLTCGNGTSNRNNPETISGKHPFRNFFSNRDVEFELPNKEIRYEVLMFYIVLANINQGKSSEQLSFLLHEYLLIYGFFSEILVHSQEHYGFEQFQNITNNNGREKVDGFQLNKFYQLSGNNNNLFNFIEFRFSPKDTVDKQIDLIHKIDTEWNKFLNNENVQNKDSFKNSDYRLIAHFIKKCDKYQNAENDDNIQDDSIRNSIRYYDLRNELDVKCNKLISTIRVFGDKNKIIAVDAAASEFDTPPEVFAPIFRKLRRMNIVRHFTYHAGEDFYHILDGLRAIYEAITFLDLQHGDRIGHASAAGTNVDTWADILMQGISIPQGIYLDDLIFAHCFILEQKIENLYVKLPMLEIKIQEIARKVCGRTFSLEDLTSAWKKRYLDPRKLKEKNVDVTLIGIADDTYNSVDSLDFELLSLYNKKEIYKKYKEPIEISCFEIFNSAELSSFQKKMLAFMHKREIVIESLPTSNLRIGYHRSLKSFQLFNWYKWKNEGNSIPPVVLGTDDPGIFQTNIYNEYAMLYCFLVYEKRLSRSDTARLVQDIHNNSRIYAFK